MDSKWEWFDKGYYPWLSVFSVSRLSLQRIQVLPFPLALSWVAHWSCSKKYFYFFLELNIVDFWATWVWIVKAHLCAGFFDKHIGKVFGDFVSLKNFCSSLLYCKNIAYQTQSTWNICQWTVYVTAKATRQQLAVSSSGFGESELQMDFILIPLLEVSCIP